MSSRSLGIEKEAGQVGTVTELTGIFESIASMRIGKIKDRVQRSQAFFAELWKIYTQLRVDPTERLVGKNGTKRDKPNGSNRTSSIASIGPQSHPTKACAMEKDRKAAVASTLRN